MGIRALKYACVFILLVVSSMYFFMQRVDREEIIPVESAEILPGTSELSFTWRMVLLLI
ncbi:MAG: hypothetical protein ACLTZT_14960 [Butyricimonas faecalis]